MLRRLTLDAAAPQHLSQHSSLFHQIRKWLTHLTDVDRSEAYTSPGHVDFAGAPEHNADAVL